MKNALLNKLLLSLAPRLKLKTLFYIVATLFVLNLIIPDPLPLVDELILGLFTLLLASYKNDTNLEQSRKNTNTKNEPTSGTIIEGEFERKS